MNAENHLATFSAQATHIIPGTIWTVYSDETLYFKYIFQNKYHSFQNYYLAIDAFQTF